MEQKVQARSLPICIITRSDIYMTKVTSPHSHLTKNIEQGNLLNEGKGWIPTEESSPHFAHTENPLHAEPSLAPHGGGFHLPYII